MRWNESYGDLFHVTNKFETGARFKENDLNYDISLNAFCTEMHAKDIEVVHILSSFLHVVYTLVKGNKVLCIQT